MFQMVKATINLPGINLAGVKMTCLACLPFLLQLLLPLAINTAVLYLDLGRMITAPPLLLWKLWLPPLKVVKWQRRLHRTMKAKHMHNQQKHHHGLHRCFLLAVVRPSALRPCPELRGRREQARLHK